MALADFLAGLKAFGNSASAGTARYPAALVHSIAMDQPYSKSLQDVRDLEAQDGRNSPNSTLAGTLGGAVTTGIATGGSGFARLAAQGAAQGGISGLTEGGENPLQDAALGAGLGAFGGGSAAALNKGAQLARTALGKNPMVQDAMRYSMAAKEHRTLVKLADKTGLSPEDARRAVELKLPLGLTGKDAKLVQSLRGQQQAATTIESKIANQEWQPASRAALPGVVDAAKALAGQAVRVGGGYGAGYGAGLVTGMDPNATGLGGALIMGGHEFTKGKANLAIQAAQSAATILPKAGVRNLGNAGRGALAAAVPVRDAAQSGAPASSELDQYKAPASDELEQYRVKDEKPSSDELEQYRVR
jgi:hypothetical protein